MSFYIESSQTEIVSLREELRLAQEKNEILQGKLNKNREVLNHFRQAVDNSPNAIFSINNKGHITTWNPSCVAVFGHNASVLGRHFRQIIHDENQVDFIEKEILKGWEVKTLSNLDLVYRCQPGDIKEMVSRIYPVEDDSGVVNGFVFANTDVTERNRIHRELDQYRHHLEELVDERTVKLKDEIWQRKRAQQDLQASYDVLVTILDSMDLAVRVVSLDQNEIIFCNNCLKDLLEQGRKNVPDYQLFAPIAEFPASAEIGSSHRFNEAQRQTLICFDPALNRWFLLHERCISWVDRCQVRLQVATDITERKQIDEERQRAEKLESLGVLAGGIAHDFNNLLTGLLGSLSLLKCQIQAGIPKYSLIDAAIKATTHATSLTQQLLTFSKGGDPILSVLSIDEILRESVSFALHGSSVKATIESDKDLSCVEADAGLLRQVFHNLAINAKHAMSEGGSIFVTAVNCSRNPENAPGDFPVGDYVKIEFSDNGPGIPSEIIDKIFDPYFTTKTKGEGLGLAMVHNIIVNHNGHIIAMQNHDRGATFQIYLPATKKNDEGRVKVELDGIKACGRILFMDDEETIRELGEQILNHLGYTVDTVADGEAALLRFKESFQTGNVYDAVILDLTIPGGMGGEAVARQLVRIKPDVKLIVSSGYSDSPVMADCARFGFAAVLKKPYQVDEMTTVLAKMI